MHFLDTGENRNSLGRLVAEIMLQVLSYVAQQERDFIRQRQAEGIAAAKQRAFTSGRKRNRFPRNFPI